MFFKKEDDYDKEQRQKGEAAFLNVLALGATGCVVGITGLSVLAVCCLCPPIGYVAVKTGLLKKAPDAVSKVFDVVDDLTSPWRRK